jgi:hypothetical protein
MEVEKIQKFVLKDNFNQSKHIFRLITSLPVEKKTIVFELEGVLVNLLSQEEAQSI